MIDELEQYLGQYKWVLTIGFIGGLLNIGSRADKGTGRKFADLVIGLVSSMFFGWISYEVINFIWQNEKIALAGCGFFAWKGATWVGEKVDKFIDSKIANQGVQEYPHGYDDMPPMPRNFDKE